jgi:hypothetical protein
VPPEPVKLATPPDVILDPPEPLACKVQYPKMSGIFAQLNAPPDTLEVKYCPGDPARTV